MKTVGRLCMVGGVLALLVSTGESAADSPRCDFQVTGPYQTDTPYRHSSAVVVSKASFHCVAAYPGARARVALQRRVNGQWTTLGQTRQTIDIARGRHYTVRTKVGCQASSTFTGEKIRTFFALKTHSGRFELPSAADPSLCRFKSRQ
jgi:hypothetical protein